MADTTFESFHPPTYKLCLTRLVTREFLVVKFTLGNVFILLSLTKWKRRCELQDRSQELLAALPSWLQGEGKS